MSGNPEHTKANWRSFPPFYRHLDLSLESLAEGRSVIRLPYQAHFGNSRGEVHGGIVASLMDIALSQAVRSTLNETQTVATVSLNLAYLAPATGELTCRGVVIRGGRTIVFAEGEINDADGKSVCRASGTYRVIGWQAAKSETAGDFRRQ